jgi:hypothetical protein
VVKSILFWCILLIWTARVVAQAGGSNGQIQYNCAGTLCERSGSSAAGSPLGLPSSVSLSGTNPTLVLNSPSPTNRALLFQTDTNNSWLIYVNSEPQSGGNAGSNFIINRYSDGGAYLDSPLTINRASGQITANDSLTVFGSATANHVRGLQGATDWLSSYGQAIANVPGAFESSIGTVGLVGASRNSDNTGNPAAAVGTMGLAFNYSRTGSAGWGFYGECRRSAGTDTCWASELDATEGDPAARPPLPYGSSAPSTVALLLASGGGCGTSLTCYTPSGNLTAHSAGAALQIAQNNADFLRGIVFVRTALHGSDGSDSGGTSIAIEAARGQLFQWDRPGGGGIDGNGGVFQFGSIATSASTGTSRQGKLLWSDTGLVLQDGASATHVTISNDAGITVNNGAVSAPFLHTKPMTISSLNAVDPTPSDGDRAFVIDASTCNFNTAVGVGGGSLKCPVVRSGSSWVAG